MTRQIDWNEQWAAHSQHYCNGYVRLDLSPYGRPPIRLKPGPGFGDLSHPTTRMVIALMAGLINNKRVLDIGCGSGILSIASAALGAERVIGIDIDPEALLHSQENARLNQVEDKTMFMSTEESSNQLLLQPDIILMNMISSEQENVFNSLPQLLTFSAIWIVSGLLETQKNAYLEVAKERNWEFLEELREEGWLAMKLISRS